MPRQGYEEILAKLDGVMDFCRVVGLGDLAERGRLGDYRRRMARLVDVMQAIRRGEAPAAAMAAIDGEGLQYLAALIESTELGDLLDFLRSARPEAVASKLAKVLKGPPLLIDETPTSNEARNFLFELTLASKIWRGGVEPELGESPDLACVVAGKRLLIECKRPFREAGVKKAVNDARSMLRGRLDGQAPGTRGVIAISLSKVLNAGDKLFAFSGEASGRTGLERAVAGAAERFRPTWQGLAKTKDIVGVVFHLLTGAVDREQNMYFVGQQLDGYPLAKPGSADDRAFLELGRALEKTRV